MAINLNVNTMTAEQLRAVLQAITAELEKQKNLAGQNQQQSSGQGQGGGQSRRARKTYNKKTAAEAAGLENDPNYEIEQVRKAMRRQNKSGLLRGAKAPGPPSVGFLRAIKGGKQGLGLINTVGSVGTAPSLGTVSGIASSIARFGPLLATPVGATVAAASVATLGVLAYVTLDKKVAENYKNSADARTASHRSSLKAGDKAGTDWGAWQRHQDNVLAEMRNRDQWRRDNQPFFIRGGRSNLEKSWLGGEGPWATLARGAYNLYIGEVNSKLSGHDETILTNAEVEKRANDKAEEVNKNFEDLKDAAISAASLGSFAEANIVDANMLYDPKSRERLVNIQQNAAKLFEDAEKAKQGHRQFVFFNEHWKQPRND